ARATTGLGHETTGLLPYPEPFPGTSDEGTVRSRQIGLPPHAARHRTNTLTQEKCLEAGPTEPMLLEQATEPPSVPRHLLAEVRRQIIAWLVLQNHQRRVVPQAVSRFQHTQDEIGLLAGHETLTGASAERLVESTHV